MCFACVDRLFITRICSSHNCPTCETRVSEQAYISVIKQVFLRRHTLGGAIFNQKPIQLLCPCTHCVRGRPESGSGGPGGISRWNKPSGKSPGVSWEQASAWGYVVEISLYVKQMDKKFDGVGAGISFCAQCVLSVLSVLWAY